MRLTKASQSKQATVAFPGSNYDITRFARIFRVGYCSMNREKTTLNISSFDWNAIQHQICLFYKRIIYISNANYQILRANNSSSTSKLMDIVKMFARANFVQTLRAHLALNQANFLYASRPSM